MAILESPNFWQMEIKARIFMKNQKTVYFCNKFG